MTPYYNARMIAESIHGASRGTSEMTSYAEEFLIGWLREKPSPLSDEVWEHLTSLQEYRGVWRVFFRGCRKLRNGRYESYTPYPDIAHRFAGKDNYVLCMNKETTSFRVLDLGQILLDIIDNNSLSHELTDLIETFIGEEEFIIRTDTSAATLFVAASVDEAGILGRIDLCK